MILMDSNGYRSARTDEGSSGFKVKLDRSDLTYTAMVLNLTRSCGLWTGYCTRWQ